MDEIAFRAEIEPHRRALLALCYRMSGSWHDAEELVQEALVRAWRGFDAFEGRASIRTWLYRVTTNVCLDALDQRRARVLPLELGPPNGAMSAPALDEPWLEPSPAWVAAERAPDATIGAKESVAFAFLVALQKLPARQRAVLLLRDVVGYDAAECAHVLDMSVAAANSTLQRARETVGKPPARRAAADADVKALLAKYIAAWENKDVDAFVSLLKEDATLAMPPFTMWFQGAPAIGAAISAMVFVPTRSFAFEIGEANGMPALLTRENGAPASVHVLDVDGDRIAGVMAFLDARMIDVVRG